MRASTRPGGAAWWSAPAAPARAVVLALADAGAAEVVVVDRSPGRAAAGGGPGRAGRAGRGARDGGGVDLVVNATPVGWPGVAPGATLPAVDPATLGPGQVVADLVYHPLVTPWLDAARPAGRATVGGLGMLVHQAAAQQLAWTGEEPPVRAMWAAVRRALEPG